MSARCSPRQAGRCIRQRRKPLALLLGTTGRSREVTLGPEVRTVRVRTDQSLGLVNNLELTIFQDLTNVDRLQRVLIVGVHRFLATRGIELEAIDSLAHLIDIEASGFLDRGFPDIDAKVGRLDRVIRNSLGSPWQLVVGAIGLEALDEL